MSTTNDLIPNRTGFQQIHSKELAGWVGAFHKLSGLLTYLQILILCSMFSDTSEWGVWDQKVVVLTDDLILNGTGSPTNLFEQLACRMSTFHKTIRSSYRSSDPWNGQHFCGASTCTCEWEIKKVGIQHTNSGRPNSEWDSLQTNMQEVRCAPPGNSCRDLMSTKKKAPFLMLESSPWSIKIRFEWADD